MLEKFKNPDKLTASKYIAVAMVLSTIDNFVPLLNIISLVLYAVSLNQLIHEQNNHFKIARKSLIKMAVAYIVLHLSGFIPDTGIFTVDTSNIVAIISRGIYTIYFIYLTHYTREGFILDAKYAKINYVKLGLNSPWTVFALLVMGYYVCKIVFRYPFPEMVGVFTILSSILYASKFINSSKMIYGEKITKSNNIK